MKKYPMEFSLENGTQVVINNTGNNSYDFTLTPEEGPASQFTYIDDENFTAAIEDSLDANQLDALRKFWLEQETGD